MKFSTYEEEIIKLKMKKNKSSSSFTLLLISLFNIFTKENFKTSWPSNLFQQKNSMINTIIKIKQKQYHKPISIKNGKESNVN